MKLISSKTHGIIDHIVGPALMIVPRLIGWPKRVTTVLAAVGLFHLIYSAFTKYEMGAAPVLPYKGHLAIDAVVAAGTAAMPAMFTESKRSGVMPALLAIGAAEGVITALSALNLRKGR